LKQTGLEWLKAPYWRNFYMHAYEPPRPESVEQLARQVFTDLYQTIIFHESGSMAGDVESVHDMRVAVRRLRVALNNFAVCMAKDDRKRLRSSLENLADSLGGVRDMDVMIASLKDSAPIRATQEPSQNKVAIAKLIGRLRARRRTRLRALMNYLSGAEYAGFKRESPSDWIKTGESGTDVSLSAHNARDGETEVHSTIGTPVNIVEEGHGQAA
jgi:CHAD domain-containing protein